MVATSYSQEMQSPLLPDPSPSKVPSQCTRTPHPAPTGLNSGRPGPCQQHKAAAHLCLARGPPLPCQVSPRPCESPVLSPITPVFWKESWHWLPLLDCSLSCSLQSQPEPPLPRPAPSTPKWLQTCPHLSSSPVLALRPPLQDGHGSSPLVPPHPSEGTKCATSLTFCTVGGAPREKAAPPSLLHPYYTSISLSCFFASPGARCALSPELLHELAPLLGTLFSNSMGTTFLNMALLPAGPHLGHQDAPTVWPTMPATGAREYLRNR